MNSLEFIEKEISFYERVLEEHSKIESKIKVLEEMKQSVKTLHQIKTKLEAWEVVKRYTVKSEDTIETGYYFIKGLDSEFETIKKALEVKDE